MIKLENINNILNICGKYIRNDKTNRTAKIERVTTSKYEYEKEKKYYIADKDGVIISGTEHEIIVTLLNWSVI